MDPIVLRAVQRAAVAFLVTLVVGSGVVFAIDSAGGDGEVAGSPSASADPDGNGEGEGPTAPSTPNAYLVWIAGGIPENAAAELTTIRRVQKAAVATAGVGWLTRSLDADGEVVDAPESPYMVPLEVTGIDPRAFSSFLPRGEHRDLVRGLGADQVILSSSSARRRGLGEGATLELAPGLQLGVAGVVPDQLVGGYEVVVVRQTAERLGAGHDVVRYALLRMRKNRTPPVERVAADVEELVAREVRDPAIEVRAPGETELLRAHDGSATAGALKKRFGEFTAYPTNAGTLEFDDAWFEEQIDTRQVPRIGTAMCHKKTLTVLRRAMAEIDLEAPLGDIGPCWEDDWGPGMAQGPLPSALWGASIRLNVSLNRPGIPPLMDARIVETMQAWGFRWAGDDAYPDGSLFEYLRPPPRGEAAPSPTD